MPYAVVLNLDQDFHKFLQSIWDQFEASNIHISPGIRSITPHITLAIYEEIRCGECKKRIEEITPPLGISTLPFNHFGIFTTPDRVLFLAPPINNALVAFHQSLHAGLEEYSSSSWKIYEPGFWVPHNTIINNLTEDDLKIATGICAEVKLPIIAKITEICMVTFDPMQPIFQIPT